jgi:hypothetical protein
MIPRIKRQILVSQQRVEVPTTSQSAPGKSKHRSR